MQSLWTGIELVLLDRDGVLNHDSPDFILSPADWVAKPGALSAVRWMNDSGFHVALCSNQSAVGRRLMSMTTLREIEETMHAALAFNGARLDATFYCPHHPNDGCRCRKPRPGLLERAMRHFAIPPGKTIFIGDRGTDLAAAAAAGCRGARVDDQTSLAHLVSQPAMIAPR